MRIFVLLSMVFVGACAVMYKAPTSGDMAQVRVVAPGFGGVGSLRVVYYDDQSCEKDQVFGLISIFSTTKSDENSSIPETKDYDGAVYFDRMISSEKVASFAIRGYAGNQYCTAHFTFTPKKESMYEIVYGWRENVCITRINEIYEKDGKLIRVDAGAKKSEVKCQTGFSGNTI